MVTLLRALRNLVLGSLVGYFALWACAPMSSGPPPVPLAAPPEGERAWEHPGRMGAVANFAVSPPDYVVEGPIGYGGSTTMWIGRSLGERGEIGAIADFAMLGQLGYLGYMDVPVTPSGGFYLRKDLNPNPDVYLGVSGSLGWMWGSVGMPLGWQVHDRVWMYTHPQLAIDLVGFGQLPLGVAVENNRGTGHLTAEVGVHAPSVAVGFGVPYTAVPYVSVGYEARR